MPRHDGLATERHLGVARTRRNLRRDVCHHYERREERSINERDALSRLLHVDFFFFGRQFLKVDARGNGVVDFCPLCDIPGPDRSYLMLVGVFFVFTNRGEREKGEEEVIYNNTRLS